jgi:hypothetical protein
MVTSKCLEFLNVTAFWDQTMCSLVDRNHYFGGILHLQDRRKIQERTRIEDV